MISIFPSPAKNSGWVVLSKEPEVYSTPLSVNFWTFKIVFNTALPLAIFNFKLAPAALSLLKITEFPWSILIVPEPKALAEAPSITLT